MKQTSSQPWLAVALTSIFLSAQHIFAPFLPDDRFITYHLVMSLAVMNQL